MNALIFIFVSSVLIGWASRYFVSRASKIALICASSNGSVGFGSTLGDCTDSAGLSFIHFEATQKLKNPFTISKRFCIVRADIFQLSRTERMSSTETCRSVFSPSVSFTDFTDCSYFKIVPSLNCRAFASAIHLFAASRTSNVDSGLLSSHSRISFTAASQSLKSSDFRMFSPCTVPSAQIGQRHPLFLRDLYLQAS